MTPKEKAIELVSKYIDYVNCWDDDGNSCHLLAIAYTKECVLILIEQIDQVIIQERAFESLDYWKEVKQEIEKL